MLPRAPMYDEWRAGGEWIRAWIEGVPLEEEARLQLERTSRLPILAGHIAVMPDVHFGLGATVGSVVPTRGAIVPAAVGVDIGCGMVARQTSVRADQLPDDLAPLRAAIEAAVPVGFSAHEEPVRYASDFYRMWSNDRVDQLASKMKIHPVRQLATLGGGNHFIELCLDENDRLWVMLHSGSRGIGNRIGQRYIEAAKRRCDAEGIQLENRDLAWLPEGTPEFKEYVAGLQFAQAYARVNRDLMLREVCQAIEPLLPPLDVPGVPNEHAVNCHHNYVSSELVGGTLAWVTRKGAVSARRGQLGIIPGSMGAKSFIVEGKGCEDSHNSCSHGAGRRMSRGAARKSFTVEDHEAATRGIECRKDEGVLDETPGAYKDIDAVMAAQRDLVDVVHTLRQIVVVKG